MPHTIERAKSGRAKCRKCKEKIEKDELRFGHEIDGQFGEALQWYHLKCAAEKTPVDLEATLKEYGDDVPNRAELDDLIAANRKNQKPTRLPYAEAAPTGRSSCLACGEKIARAEVRVAIEREIDAGGVTRLGAGYLHPACAAGFEESPENLADEIAANSTSLDPEEIEQVQSQLGQQ